jgi:uncharacterized protein (TIGR02001 family)
MRKTVKALLAASTFAAIAATATPALADDAAPPSEFTITGSAAIVSQYRFRGLAQSDNKPAVQASITLSHKSGFYLATWGSSASAGNGPINIGGTEIDVYGGYTHTFSKSGVTIDMGGYGYIYPGAPLGNYYEIYGSVAKTFGPATAKLGINVAPGQEVFNYNWTSPKHSNVYVYGELGGGIPKTPITIHTHLGYTTGGFAWAKDYLDYTAGVSYKWKALTFDISVVGTNVTKSNITNAFYPAYLGTGGCLSASTCTTYFNRMSKVVPVASLTASF